MSVQKIIWTCWFQGREQAPELVEKCIASWEARNPAWDVRCLDADTIHRYVDLGAHVDLSHQKIGAASLSDLVRLLLLHEYGGVWVDATTYCNVPLDEWLPSAAHTGFFAFARPAEDRDIATWFLAVRPGHALLTKWLSRALAYWRGRQRTRDYFWVHHQFDELCAVDPEAMRAWQDVPRISADGPHSIQVVGLYESYEASKAKIDWTVPVYKLTHRVDRERVGPDCLVGRLLDLAGVETTKSAQRTDEATPPIPIGLLKVGTDNLGDHIQIIAGKMLLSRAGFEPSFLVDRDKEIAHPPSVESEAGILVNGWFKFYPDEWPPHRAFRPIYLGFHIRLFQAPTLVSSEALEHYAANGRIGCRDRYTLSLLRAHGVESFLSHCLSLSFPRRLPDAQSQTETFVVSRDKRILDYLPASLGDFTYLSQYSGAVDFAENMEKASALLDDYRSRAKLIVTTMLHCALPAIAMGIPVVVFLPPNEGAAHISDLERFSSLAEIVRVFKPAEASFVDWRGYTPDVSLLKLRILDELLARVKSWGDPRPIRYDGFVPDEEALEWSPTSDEVFKNSERFERLAAARAPDRQRWGVRSSYKEDWSLRSEIAAKWIPDAVRVLEIGTGTGQLRNLLAGRCLYTGADLQPLDDETRAVDIERDPIPSGSWDVIVLLGVIEYLHDPVAALAKVGAAAQRVVLSYCVPRAGPQPLRFERGWMNALTEQELTNAMSAEGLGVTAREDLQACDEFDQRIFVFERSASRELPPQRGS